MSITLHDLKPMQPDFVEDVIAGLTADDMAIPPIHLYDQRGSELFRSITTTEEYYLTRTELELLRRHKHDIAQLLPKHITMLELGAANSEKARSLLTALTGNICYTPLDIAKESLAQLCYDMQALLPDISYNGICADFCSPWQLPASVPSNPALVFFSGSTLGNFEYAQGVQLLQYAVDQLEGDCWLLLGLDICEDEEVLESAYDDAQGYSSEFALNLIRRIGSVFDTDLKPSDCRYLASYDRVHRRIEMSIELNKATTISTANRENPWHIELPEQSRIRTEYSYKFNDSSINQLAKDLQLETVQSWRDSEHRMGLYLFKKQAHQKF